MQNAEIQGTTLTSANLKGANLTDEQLITTSHLAHATMPNGSLYDSRYTRQRPFTLYRNQNNKAVVEKIDPTRPERMSKNTLPLP
jgi:uncharacterized protein YjbI with pentapeptide repeats